MIQGIAVPLSGYLSSKVAHYTRQKAKDKRQKAVPSFDPLPFTF